MAKFHPQFWQGEWLCCGQEDKLALGCEEYNLFGDGETVHFRTSHSNPGHRPWTEHRPPSLPSSSSFFFNFKVIIFIIIFIFMLLWSNRVEF